MLRPDRPISYELDLSNEQPPKPLALELVGEYVVSLVEHSSGQIELCICDDLLISTVLEQYKSIDEGLKVFNSARDMLINGASLDQIASEHNLIVVRY